MESRKVYEVINGQRIDRIAEFYKDIECIFICVNPQTDDNADDVENVLLVIEQNDVEEPMEDIWNRMPEDITDWEDRF